MANDGLYKSYVGKCLQHRIPTLKMKAVYSSATLVPTYKRHNSASELRKQQIAEENVCERVYVYGILLLRKF